jgi:hypothetical protein
MFLKKKEVHKLKIMIMAFFFVAPLFSALIIWKSNHIIYYKKCCRIKNINTTHSLYNFHLQSSASNKNQNFLFCLWWLLLFLYFFLPLVYVWNENKNSKKIISYANGIEIINLNIKFNFFFIAFFCIYYIRSNNFK